MIEWRPLDSEQKLADLITLSQAKPQLIFKHSISCPTSAMVKSRLERAAVIDNADYNMLDLWHYRAVSDLVARKFGIRHESPQILVIDQGKCIYNESHYAITQENVAAIVAAI